ncbi:hypothetical protein AVEN_29429-1 [Araneus ventricosus]|uniref:Uncharacterized protein n=1 Tax=Araneus ventricosus TaxID=182803 RepID=A0A4Y2D0F4_ARAVE|nr:hypothetical protein AVEN_29429-1 [Araneus ventricosus]
MLKERCSRRTRNFLLFNQVTLTAVRPQNTYFAKPLPAADLDDPVRTDCISIRKKKAKPNQNRESFSNLPCKILLSCTNVINICSNTLQSKTLSDCETESICYADSSNIISFSRTMP